MARSTKFTQQTIDGLLDALRNGASYVGACASVGIVFETFRKWREKGEKIANGEIRKTKSNEAFEDFYYSVKEAEQASFTAARKVVLDAAKDGDWKAAEAYLKGRDPEWGKDNNVNVNNTSVIKVTLTGDD